MGVYGFSVHCRSCATTVRIVARSAFQTQTPVPLCIFLFVACATWFFFLRFRTFATSIKNPLNNPLGNILGHPGKMQKNGGWESLIFNDFLNSKNFHRFSL